MEVIVAQRALSDSIAIGLGGVIQSAYPQASAGVDIGSWYRGTNLDAHPDVDIIFLGVDSHIERGPASRHERDDWRRISTRDGLGIPLQNYRTSTGVVTVDASYLRDVIAVRGIEPPTSVSFESVLRAPALSQGGYETLMAIASSLRAQGR